MAFLDSEGQSVHSGPDAALNRHVVPRHIEGREFGISNIVTSVLASYGGRHDPRAEATVIFTRSGKETRGGRVAARLTRVRGRGIE